MMIQHHSRRRIGPHSRPSGQAVRPSADTATPSAPLRAFSAALRPATCGHPSPRPRRRPRAVAPPHGRQTHLSWWSAGWTTPQGLRPPWRAAIAWPVSLRGDDDDDTEYKTSLEGVMMARLRDKVLPHQPKPSLRGGSDDHDPPTVLWLGQPFHQHWRHRRL